MAFTVSSAATELFSIENSRDFFCIFKSRVISSGVSSHFYILKSLVYGLQYQEYNLQDYDFSSRKDQLFQ